MQHAFRIMQVAVDIACGNGQATLGIARHFQNVIGIDASTEQVKQAGPAPNVRFQLGTAENTSLAPESADLVTVAQAMHWFRLPEFYREMHRILKPNATLAIWGYLYGHIQGGPDPEKDAKADAVKKQLWSGLLGPYWDEKRQLLDAGYAGMEPPSPPYADVERHEFTMTKDVTIGQLVGYATTWSCYATYCRQHSTVKGSTADPVVQFTADLCAAYGTDDLSYATKIVYPMVLLLARKPAGGTGGAGTAKGVLQ